MSIIKVNEIQKKKGSTLTLGGACTAVTLASGATQSGFGRTGTVDWCTTAKTSPLTAESGKGYFVNTSGGAVTVTLPSSPSAGDIISIKDYAGTFCAACKAVTVGRGGSKINGLCIDATLNTEGDSITLVYVDGTKGWLNIQTDDTVQGNAHIAATGGCVATCGDFKIHTFNADGNFVVSNVGQPCGSTTVEYLVVAGGGGGASGAGGAGGGGGGGHRSNFPSPATGGLPVSVQSYPISIGGGGAGGPNPGPGGYSGVTGVNSVFSTITSAGGGGGREAPGGNNGNGGSGGGGSYQTTCGGTGNTPPTSDPATPTQGNNGGTAALIGSGNTSGGGGGGAGAVGQPGPASPNARAGTGGCGAANSITGSSVTRAGGGAGHGQESSANRTGSGGPGGGAASGANGTDNLGGGGGSNAPDGGNGGKGVVIIRYKFQ